MCAADPGRLTVAVASGKGGTGKTTVSVNLAVTLARGGARVALVDCDVEEPNDHLFLAPMCGPSTVEPVSVAVPSFDADACDVCGACRDACRFGALRILGGAVVLFPELCHGCGRCGLVCPTDAVAMSSRRVGETRIARADTGHASAVELVTGVLDVGEVRTPDVVRAARKAGTGVAADITLLDAPPGVSCSAVASVAGADAALLVTEPTPFGAHDLELALDLTVELGVPAAVVLNRAGPVEERIERICEERGVPIVARIPFDRRVAEVYAEGGLLVDRHPGAAAWFDDTVSSLPAGPAGSAVPSA